MKLRLALVGASCGAIEFRVATFSGSRHLDKRCDVACDGSVADLKRSLEASFPGNPPASVQRLFYGTKYLGDEEELLEAAIDEDDAGSRVELLLDMVPPAPETYRPPDSTEDRVKAYVAEKVAMDWTWREYMERAKRQASSQAEGAQDDDDDEEEAVHCTGMSSDLAAAEATMLRVLEPQLEALATTVTTGVVEARDSATAPARDTLFGDLARRSAVFLNVDWRESAKMALGLLVASKMGVKGAFRQTLLACCVPLVFLGQTRPARYVSKVLWYLLPRIDQESSHALNSVYVLFAAPQQVMLSLDEARYLRELFRPLVRTDELDMVVDQAEEEEQQQKHDDDNDAAAAAADDDDDFDDFNDDDDDDDDDFEDGE